VATSIELYPTCDIHLLLDGPGGPGVGTAYQLLVRDYSDAAIDLSADVARTKYTDFDPAIATVSSTGLIAPVAVGETFCRVRHTDPLNAIPSNTFVSEIVIRIRVHRKIDTLWFGNNLATLVEGQSHYVLSVYAKFDDGTFGDISSHPYLTFTSSNVVQVDVSSAGDLEPDPGRLSAFAVTRGTPVTVTVSVGALSAGVPVFVEPGFSTARPFLERIHGAGPARERRNLLFVAEGFTAADRTLFRRLVVLLKDELFGSKLNSPYDLLRNRFNVWMAFDPSAEEGVTCAEWIDIIAPAPFGLHQAKCLSNIDATPATTGDYTLRDLVRRVGLPDRYHPIPTSKAAAETAWASTVAGTDYAPAKLDPDVVAEWLKLADYRLLQARDSRFGIMNGTRYGDRDSRRVDPADDPVPLMQWYDPPDVPHLVHLDRRRARLDWNLRVFISRYLDALEPVDGGDADTSDVWVGGAAPDRDLSVFLVNSTLDGGSRSAIGLAVSARQNTRLAQVHVDGDKTDHSVPEIEVLSLPALVGSSLDEMVSILAHELTHTFALGDEYEAYAYPPSHNVLSETDLNTRASIEADNNLVHHYTIATRPGEHGIINVKRVKWSQWHRIERCSVLAANPELLGGGRMRVRLPAGDRAKWDRPDMHNTEVWLRSRTINGDAVSLADPEARWLLEGPLKILQIDPDGSYVLATTFADSFRAQDLLYAPVRHDGKPLGVFHPNVQFALEIFGEPFAMKADVTKGDNEAGYPPPHALVPDFDPRHPAYVVGLYEGAGTYNSRVYRPSGMCKMRKSRRIEVNQKDITIGPAGDRQIGALKPVSKFVPFCYVCRYVLVNTLDPTLLEGLEYPV